MITLKDIKVSKNRIPVQNAIWLRPTGGMSFKIYYPHGGDWSEIALDGSSPSPTPTPTPTPTPETKTVSLEERTDCEKWKVIAGKCIPLKARVGNRYFFADGRLKFKSENFSTQIGEKWYKDVYSEGYNGNGERVFTRFPVLPFLWKDNWNPILVTIRDVDYYTYAQKEGAVNANCSKIVLEGYTVYFSTSLAEHLTCETTSPNFKVIDGHLRNIARPTMPKFVSNQDWAEQVASHYVARKLKYRGSRVRGTRMWSYRSDVPPVKVPISLKRQWKPLDKEKFGSCLVYNSNTHSSSGIDSRRKTFMIQELKKGRKSIIKLIIRRKPKTGRDGWYAPAQVFEEINFLK